MPTVVRWGALLALMSMFVIPSAASAQRPPGGGGYDYEWDGCESVRAMKRGKCDSQKPDPSISTSPSTPRAGAPVQLNADSPGRGLKFAWDLDNDGAFDDATGPSVTRTFTAGDHKVRVLATDEDDRTGVSERTISAHAADHAPTASLYVTPSAPRRGQQVSVEVDGYDTDGSVKTVEVDLDGNGTSRPSPTSPPARRRIARTRPRSRAPASTS